MLAIEPVDVVVVGAGIIGASVAFNLVNEGLRVLLLEREVVASGPATSRSGAIVRSYHSSPGTRKLAIESHQVFENWSEVVGGTCGFKRTGALLLVGRDLEKLVEVAAQEPTLVRQGFSIIPIELASELCPNIQTSDVTLAAFEPDAGYADAVIATRSLIEAVRRRGSAVLEGTTCFDILAEKGRVNGVRTNFGTIASSLVVVCNGSDYLTLLNPLCGPLPAIAKRVFTQFIRSQSKIETQWPVVIDDVTKGYLRCDGPGTLLVGCKPGLAIGDLANPPPINPVETQEIEDFLNHRFPWLTAGTYGGNRVGTDMYTPDLTPIVDELPSVKGLWVVLGTNGSGFRVAPALGKLLSNCLLGTEAPHWKDMFGLQRFSPTLAGTN